MKRRIISFDADGTLVKRDLIEEFWFNEVPKLYAELNNLKFREALEKVKKSYEEIGPRDIRWYLPQYWFDRFGFKEDPSKIIKDLVHVKEVYRDALHVLDELYGEYKLIVISNAPREFLNIQLESIDHYFEKIYSCVSDLEKVKKGSEVYREICYDIDINPKNLIHVGDDKEFDYEAPKKLGIESYFIDRERNYPDDDKILKDLRDLLGKI